MALAAGKIQLAFTPKEVLPALLKVAGGLTIYLHIIGQAPGEAGHQCSQGQQFHRFIVQGWLLLMSYPALVDPAVQIDQPLLQRVNAGIAGRCGSQ